MVVAALAVTALAASAVSAMGAIQSGNAQAKAGEYNAEIEQQRAQQAIDQSTADAAQQEQDNKRKQGDIAAAYGAAGLQMTGTPLDVMSDSARQGELTKQLTLYKGKIGAINDQEQAALDRAQGQQAQTASMFQAGSTLLSGAAKAGATMYFGGGAGSSPAKGS